MEIIGKESKRDIRDELANVEDGRTVFLTLKEAEKALSLIYHLVIQIGK